MGQRPPATGLTVVDRDQTVYAQATADGRVTVCRVSDGGAVAVHVNTFHIYDLRKIREGLRALQLDCDGPELPPDRDSPPVTGVRIVR